MRIRASEIVPGVGEAIPVMSGTPHDEGARASHSTRRGCCKRHSSGEGGSWLLVLAV